MKTKNVIFILIIALYSYSCKEQTKSETTTQEPTQEMDNSQDTESEEEELPILVGKTNHTEIRQAPYDSWFMPTYEEYKVDSTTLDPVLDDLKSTKITVFMGTWCEDSQREVPSLFKILDKIDYNYDQLTLITMTEDKTTPENFEEGKNITNVPTIIFNKDGSEVNRIVEYTLESLEKDMAKILSGQEYSHAYAEDGE